MPGSRENLVISGDHPVGPERRHRLVEHQAPALGRPLISRSLLLRCFDAMVKEPSANVLLQTQAAEETRPG